MIKLATERKHLSNLLKMVAYQAESDLVRIVMPHYRRTEDEGRTLVETALGGAGDIEVRADEIRVHLEPLSSPHRTRALAALCEQVNQTKPTFPGSPPRLRFEVTLPEGPDLQHDLRAPARCLRGNKLRQGPDLRRRQLRSRLLRLEPLPQGELSAGYVLLAGRLSSDRALPGTCSNIG